MNRTSLHRRVAMLCLLLAAAAVQAIHSGTVSAEIDPDPGPGQGALLAGPAGSLVPMPLERTEVRAEISGFTARVEVVQTFGNPFGEPIEARYVFPLPERAAVDDFIMQVGERRIRGEIRRREEARRIYETARGAGYTAALMEQERPNIFTQSVANIEPGGKVRVRIRYVETLPYSDGAYRFVFPMVVAPRYVRAGEVVATSGTATPARSPVLPPGVRSGHDIELTARIEAGIPIRGVVSDSHAIDIARSGPTGAGVTLAPSDRIPNKDFMLRIHVAGELPEAGVVAHRLDDDGFFALLVQPKAAIEPEEAAPKEILFVLDDSGSMSGAPIEMSRRLMRRALESLAPSDRFNIIRFAGDARVLAPEPLANTDRNVKLGMEAVKELQGSGGTEMIRGFRAALTQPRDPACIRIVIFLTDGQIGHEQEIFDLIRRERGDARIFTLGIGSSVNHYLLREMAELGRGAYQYIRPDGREKEAVDRFREWVTRPYLTDLTIDWGTLQVEDLQPAVLPDLYSGQTLAVVGRYLWGGGDTVILRGRLGGVPWEKHLTVSLPERSEEHAALASVWARERIRGLTMRPEGRPHSMLEAEVTSLALAYRLMSPFTSFVAVDDSVVVNPAGDPARVDQAVPMPELMSFAGCFGADGPAGILPLPADRLPEHGPPDPPADWQAAIEPSSKPGSALLKGRVTDTGGEGLPGVVLDLYDRSRIRVLQTVTDIEGWYRMPPVAAGVGYVVRIDYPGFAPMEMGPLEFAEGRSTVANFTLRSHIETTETIVIESRGNIVDTRSTKTSSHFSTEFIEGLPIIGHNYQNILSLAPGLTDTDGDGNPNVYGARAVGLQYRSDGGHITGPASGTFGQDMSEDIAEELEVVTSGASAGYGRADGGFATVVAGRGAPPATPAKAGVPEGVPGGMPGDIPGGEPVAGSASASHATRQDVEARGAIEQAALRVLADLADPVRHFDPADPAGQADQVEPAERAGAGRLSRSEGLPALAALVSVQRPGGLVSPFVRAQSLAVWALARAAATEPRLPWVRASARAAAVSLRRMRLESGGWPVHVGGPEDADATRAAELALSIAENCEPGRGGAPVPGAAGPAPRADALHARAQIDADVSRSPAAAALARRIVRSPIGPARLVGRPGACLDLEEILGRLIVW
ncbi:MAG TPA: VIT domain-containing protein [Candidatus Polarisedimenticolia bacterium]|nr:VIT domain-containing protein [Candidatus Polarisedimenticolia bacterium]